MPRPDAALVMDAAYLLYERGWPLYRVLEIGAPAGLTMAHVEAAVRQRQRERWMEAREWERLANNAPLMPSRINDMETAA